MRAFLFGILLGAAAGILYAPAKGNRTRSLLKDKFTKYSTDTADFIDTKGKTIKSRLEGLRDEVSKRIDQAASQLDTLAEQSRSA